MDQQLDPEAFLKGELSNIEYQKSKSSKRKKVAKEEDSQNDEEEESDKVSSMDSAMFKNLNRDDIYRKESLAFNVQPSQAAS